MSERAETPTPEEWAFVQETCDVAWALEESARGAFLDSACARYPHLRREIEAVLSSDDPTFLEAPAPREGFPAKPELLEEQGSFGSYRVLRTLGSGGWGVVYLVEQKQPRRELALKVLRPELASPTALRRFEFEAEALARLDHPGIGRVVEAGSHDSDRGTQLYFAMEYVRGDPLDVFLDQTQHTVPEKIQLFCRVCKAVHHAHLRGVVHRDLKPANVLVTSNGDPKIVDFGLARFLDQQGDASHRLTEHGEPLGTLSYMSPEAAVGKRPVDHRSDVYSLGVVLFEMLSGSLPHELSDLSRYEALRVIAEQGPRRLGDLKAGLRGDLEAIVSRCLDREPDLRYESVEDLRQDLSRYLQREPISARKGNRLYRARCFVARNRRALVAVLILSSLVAIAAGSAARAWWLTRDIETLNLSVVDAELARDLIGRRAKLWPLRSSRVRAMEEWILEAERLAKKLPAHREHLASLGRRALPYGEEQVASDSQRSTLAIKEATRDLNLAHNRIQLAGRQLRDEDVDRRPEFLAWPAHVAEKEKELHEALAKKEERRTWKFEAFRDRVQHERAQGSVAALTDLSRPGGALDQVKSRLRRARSVHERTIAGPEARGAWRGVIDDLSSDHRFEGFTLVPQVGLFPVGKNPRSGLWEFWLVDSGERPREAMDPRSHSRWQISSEMGLLFVLIPGGTIHVGAQSTDIDAANYDPLAVDNESPVHTANIDPYLVSKYEMTQAQWKRLAGRNPSRYAWEYLEGRLCTDLCPVESVSHTESIALLGRWCLALPTEAQWEHSARGGALTSWWFGETADEALAAQPGNILADFESWAVHSPVGSFSENGYGLHDTFGNVSEWCRDLFSRPKTNEYQPYDALHRFAGPSAVFRGGNCRSEIAEARSAARANLGVRARRSGIGLRPVFVGEEGSQFRGSLGLP